MQEDFAKRVYNTLNGYYIPSFRVPGVGNAFADGQPCIELYGEALGAYQRICARLGTGEEDEDLEVIVNAFIRISEIVGLKMYHYGALFGERGTEDIQQKF